MQSRRRLGDCEDNVFLFRIKNENKIREESMDHSIVIGKKKIVWIVWCIIVSVSLISIIGYLFYILRIYFLNIPADNQLQDFFSLVKAISGGVAGFFLNELLGCKRKS